MTDITNEREAKEFFSQELNIFTSEYAAIVQDQMKASWQIEVSHRECWEIITSLISQMFPNEKIEVATLNDLKDKIITDTIDDVRDFIIAKYSSKSQMN